MKSLFALLALVCAILLSFFSIIYGAGLIIYQMYHAHQFFHGFVALSLGTIMLFVIAVFWSLVKITDNLNAINDAVLNLVEYTLTKDKNSANRTSPLGDLLKNLGQTFGPGSIHIREIDGDGNVTDSKDFNQSDDFKDDLFGRMFGSRKKPAKNIEEMNIDELKAEEEKATKDQNFERAAKIRDEIKKRETNS